MGLSMVRTHTQSYYSKVVSQPENACTDGSYRQVSGPSVHLTLSSPCFFEMSQPLLLNFFTIHLRVMIFCINGNHHENYSVWELGKANYYRRCFDDILVIFSASWKNITIERKKFNYEPKICLLQK